MHAITDTEPLCEREENGFPISALQWNGDTPHAENRRDGKLTCELMWKSVSSSGDYHDNMNSEMFMKRTKDKLVPCFRKMYSPTIKMVLICDNAAYHHAREI